MDVPRVVVDYLLTTAYAESAQSLLRALSADVDGDEDMAAVDHPGFASLHARKQILSHILDGDITAAIEECNDAFPGALAGTSDMSVDTLFALKCQEFIEICKAKSPGEALVFAQKGPLAAVNSFVR
jgi:hypothetical protein